MKKTLVAVAALAASAAFAQSSVTLYGVADAYVGSVKTAAGVSQSVVNDGGLSQSRLGVSVKEDLGSGLAAFAVLENGLSIDTGAGGLAGTAAARKSVVGLSGSFGAVSLGRQTTPAYDATAQVLDAQPESSFSAVSTSRAGGYATSAGGFGGYLMTGDRYSNSVRYDSANFDGFSGAVQYGMGENKTATTAADNGASLNLKYANGPLGVAFAYQRDKNNSVAPTSSMKTTVLGGYYDFGPAKLNLGYTQFKNDTATTSGKMNSYNIGVTVPVGAFNIVGQYASSKVSGVAGRSNAFALEGQYALSKRTTTYVGLNETKDTIGGGSVKTHLVGIGLRHVF